MSVKIASIFDKYESIFFLDNQLCEQTLKVYHVQNYPLFLVTDMICSILLCH